MLLEEQDKVPNLCYDRYLHFAARSRVLRDLNSSSVAHWLCDLG